MGDTLIEVTLAIGIFSMVAIAVVAVMNNGTTSSQTALETTLAREEIDTQAEALRFIQSGYIADRDSGTESKYNDLWAQINDLAISPEIGGDNQPINAYGTFDSIMQSTSSCSAVYENNMDFLNNHAFVINPNNMELIRPNNINNVVFSSASTYPRLITTNQINGTDTLADSLADSSLGKVLSRVEGLYVFAVKDADSTVITSADNTSTKEESAFLDFYIRACWYGSGEDIPSTISTVVRLYNPDTTTVASKATGVWVEFNPNDVDGLTKSKGSTASVFVPVGETRQLTKNGFYRGNYYNDAYEFAGWSTNPNSSPNNVMFKDEANYTLNRNITFNEKVTLYAIWKNEYKIVYRNAYNTADFGSATGCDKYEGCTLPTTKPTQKGLVFQGWCTTPSAPPQTSCAANNFYQAGAHFPKSGSLASNTTKLYPVWKYKYTLKYHDTYSGKEITGHTKSVTRTSATYPFSIDSNSSFSNNELTRPAVSQSGNEMVLLGWSENKNGSGTIYNSTGENGASKTIKATGITKPDIDLYPVWREIITFVNVPWADSGTTPKYCGISKTESGIELRGSKKNAVNCGVAFSVGKNDTFELSADLNTSGIITHPEGIVAIIVGPLVAILSNNDGTNLNIYYGYLPLTTPNPLAIDRYGNPLNYTKLDSKTIPVNSTATIKLTKYGNVYTMSVNGKEVKIETRENNNKTYSVLASNGTVLDSGRNISELNNLKVEYLMIHNGHNCSKIFNAKLYNIRMTKSDI